MARKIPVFQMMLGSISKALSGISRSLRQGPFHRHHHSQLLKDQLKPQDKLPRTIISTHTM
jgi:hypothetical protein